MTGVNRQFRCAEIEYIMIINNRRIRGLVELDDVVRQAERSAAQHGDPASEIKHAVLQLRAGHNASSATIST